MAQTFLNLAQGVTGTLPTSNYVQGGISEYQQWRLTSALNSNASDADITSNLEIVDTNAPQTLGSGMSESGGIFTFPSTGIWEIKYEGVSQIGGNAQNRWNDWKIEATTNDSSYSLISGTGNSGALSNTANSQYSSAQSSVIFDVTNVSTHKVRFSIDVNDGSTSQMGASGYQYHGATFIRLGDT